MAAAEQAPVVQSVRVLPKSYRMLTAPSMKLMPSPMATTLIDVQPSRFLRPSCGVSINKPKRDSTEEQQQSDLHRPDDPAHQEHSAAPEPKSTGIQEDSKNRLTGGRLKIGQHVFVAGHADPSAWSGLRTARATLEATAGDPEVSGRATSQDGDHGEKKRDRDQCIEHILRHRTFSVSGGELDFIRPLSKFFQFVGDIAHEKYPGSRMISGWRCR